MKILIIPAFGLAVVSVVSPARAAPITQTLYTNDNVGNIQLFDSTGASQGSFSSLGNRYGLTLSTAGNVYVGETSAIHEYGPTGADLGVFTSTGITQPMGVTFNAAGDLLVSNFSNGIPNAGTITEYGPTGAFLGAIVTGLSSPQGIALDQVGNIYVDTSRGIIREYDSSGISLGVFATLVSGSAGTMAGLAFDQQGNLYAPTNGSIEKISPQGAELALFGTAGFVYQGIAVSSDNQIFATRVDNLIEKFGSSVEFVGEFCRNPA